MHSSVYKKVGVASAVMMASVFLSRVIGLLREMAIAYMAGAACYSLRHVQRGIDEAERSMELEPHMLLGSYLLACVFSAGGRHDEAIAAGRRVVEWSQRSPFMVMILAVVLGIAGRGNDARVLLHELLERRRTEYVANDLLGNVFAVLRRVTI